MTKPAAPDSTSAPTAAARLAESETGPAPETPRLYIACLAAYNAGYLHGVWVEALDGVDAVQDAISAMLKTSPVADVEEWAIHDYEGFGQYRLGQYCSLERACALTDFINETGEVGLALLSHYDGDVEACRAALDEQAGEYASLADFAAELTESTGDVPDHLAPYIDYAAMGRDMVLGGDIYTLELGLGRIHVLWTAGR